MKSLLLFLSAFLLSLGTEAQSGNVGCPTQSTTAKKFTVESGLVLPLNPISKSDPVLYQSVGASLEWPSGYSIGLNVIGTHFSKSLGYSSDISSVDVVAGKSSVPEKKGEWTAGWGVIAGIGKLMILPDSPSLHYGIFAKFAGDIISGKKYSLGAYIRPTLSFLTTDVNANEQYGYMSVGNETTMQLQLCAGFCVSRH